MDLNTIYKKKTIDQYYFSLPAVDVEDEEIPMVYQREIIMMISECYCINHRKTHLIAIKGNEHLILILTNQ